MGTSSLEHFHPAATCAKDSVCLPNATFSSSGPAAHLPASSWRIMAVRIQHWAQSQRPRQQQPRYSVASASVAAAGPFALSLYEFLAEQYRAAGLQPDASCVAIANTMAARLSPASWQPYSSIFGCFVRFCLDGDLQFQLTGVMWAQHLAQKGTIKASTAQPYFSAVNTVHSMLGYDKPCADSPLLASFRRGWERQQVTLVPPPAVAGLALPASLAFKLYTCLPGAVSAGAVQPQLFSLLCYVLVLRPASMLSVQWLCVLDGMLQYKPLHWKGKRLQPANAPVLQFPVGNLPFFASAIARLTASSYGLGESLWRFRGEPPPATTSAEGWFDVACQRSGFPASHGKYTLYSTRRGGAFAAAAVGVPLHMLETLGGWTQGSAALRSHYLDHGIGACPNAMFFFFPLVGAAISPHQLFNA